MAEQEPNHNSEEPMKFSLSEHLNNMDPSKLIMGPVGHGKSYELLRFMLNQELVDAYSSFAAMVPPLTEQEKSFARNELDMSEQEVERLSRFSGKRWLNALGVEYPKEWE